MQTSNDSLVLMSGYFHNLLLNIYVKIDMICTINVKNCWHNIFWSLEIDKQSVLYDLFASI